MNHPINFQAKHLELSGASRIHRAKTTKMAEIFRPIIVLNLTSEMLYVLNQRMVAQSISYAKQREVISSILSEACERGTQIVVCVFLVCK